MKRNFNRIISVIILTIIAGIFASISEAATLFNETLNYTITYKWGMIHKDAGKATLRLTNVGNTYRMILTAKTLSWADKIYKVRDTLESTALRNGFVVTGYEKTTHEGGRYGRDVLKFTRTGGNTKVSCNRVREGKDGKFSRSQKSLSAIGPGFDMLSIFYYIRLLNFHNMKKGETLKFTIFSGSKTETLTIKMIGLETLKLRNKSVRQAYKLNFKFTSDNKKKSSDDIHAWISADKDKIPLYVVGKLPIGEVRVYYTP
ncbi:MAG: DUF3108 domain-containing protein [Clostridium sp.]|nr:DUF3108 domain-containing protein [Prevotella sp.]MCM1428768.1 DUF3108 domain-containing protein [Clostridium sp.]MCM1475143.1 DUF3108 domain-containing protein [Muribaculaceae bacterium]